MQQPCLGVGVWDRGPGYRAIKPRWLEPAPIPLITKEVGEVGKEVCDETARADPQGQTR